MTVAITGASGHLGRRVADLLLERLDPSELVLLTRTPENLDARGAQVRRADFDEPDSLVAAFAGVDRMLLISAVDVGRRTAQHRAAVSAAQEAGVRHVIYTSVPNPTEDNPAAVVPSHRATEEALRASGLAWTFLRNNIYADFQIPTIAQARATGQLVTSVGDGTIAFVSREDCARAAAAVVATGGHEGQAYDITGPEAVGAGDLAALAGAEVVQVDDDTLIAGMIAGGIPESGARVLSSIHRAAREGFLGSGLERGRGPHRHGAAAAARRGGLTSAQDFRALPARVAVGRLERDREARVAVRLGGGEQPHGAAAVLVGMERACRYAPAGPDEPQLVEAVRARVAQALDVQLDLASDRCDADRRGDVDRLADRALQPFRGRAEREREHGRRGGDRRDGEPRPAASPWTRKHTFV